MKAQVIILKVKERLNKLDSQDYQNLPGWKILEAFNTFQYQWCRINTHGGNPYREGDEGSTTRIDDLQILLLGKPLTLTDTGDYFESNVSDWPQELLRHKRVNLKVTKECCSTPKSMIVYVAESANIDIYRRDQHTKPNYAWGETFGVIFGNKLQIYHNNEFQVSSCSLDYYRQPVRVASTLYKDAYTNALPAVDVDCEFKDDVAELMCMGASDILAGDTDNPQQSQRLNQIVEKSN